MYGTPQITAAPTVTPEPETNGKNIVGEDITLEYVSVGGSGTSGIDKRYMAGLSLELSLNDEGDIQTYVGSAGGNVIAVLDGFNRPISSYVYDVFGEEIKDLSGNLQSISCTGYFAEFGGDINQIRYGGMYRDAETMKYVMGVTYYDTTSTRTVNENTRFSNQRTDLPCCKTKSKEKEQRNG